MKNFKNNINSLLIVTFLILVLSFTRLLPHPANFTPIIAAGIFSGFYFRQFYLSSFIIILSMFLGDLFLGLHNTMFFTYLALSIIVLVGLSIKNLKITNILYSSVASSIIFFVITNFGAWVTLDIYTKNFSGLMQSYIMAIPFFHNTLISTLFYLLILKILFDFALKKKVLKFSS